MTTAKNEPRPDERDDQDAPSTPEEVDPRTGTDEDDIPIDNPSG